MSAWIKYLGKYYNDKKKTNPDYKYKDAMIDAAKSYKRDGKSTVETCSEKSKRDNKRKTKKNKKKRIIKKSRTYRK
jgi:hypothetical protein